LRKARLDKEAADLSAQGRDRLHREG
jgi:hypothetical protein